MKNYYKNNNSILCFLLFITSTSYYYYNIPTKLVITRSGGKLTILCKTYEELDKVVNKLISNNEW